MSLEDCTYVAVCVNVMINYGSFLMMKVANVKRDIKDKTLTIPSNVLVPLNADFDGDLYLVSLQKTFIITEIFIFN